MKIHSTIKENKELYQSYFDASLTDYIMTLVKFYGICILSFGLAYPYALCMKHEHTCHHTVIKGQRQKFIGQPGDLIVNWLWWWFLSVITFGIYGFIAHLRMERWVIANTIHAESLPE